MDYQDFKVAVLDGLQKCYKEEAEVKISKVLKNNGRSYEGIQITFKEDFCKPVPMIDLNCYYEKYEKGEGNFMECIEEIMEERKKHSCPNWLEQFAGKVIDWEYVKEHVYPILLSTKENRQMLKNLVSVPLMDLSTVYIIRDDLPGGCRSSAKISKMMLECYGVSREQLHRQALENMNKDGYEFQDMKALIKSLHYKEGNEEKLGAVMEMYVLTNAGRLYGAAGILSKQLLKNFAGNQDFFILPSSVHECIFVPVADKEAKWAFDKMVREVNRKEVGEEERLSDHCYYYDAKENEIRMCV